MSQPESAPLPAVSLRNAVRLNRDKILNPASLGLYGGFAAGVPVLVILAAGKGTRFGSTPSASNRCVARPSRAIRSTLSAA